MANCITILRILLILPILTLISPDQSFNNWAALVIFVIASVSDHLDGYVARKTQTASNLGALLDLLADKLLICIVLSYVISITGELFLTIPALIIISREIIISSLRQYVSEKEGNNPIAVNFFAKIKTTLQMIAVSFLIISPNFESSFFFITLILIWISAYISIHSLFLYLKTYKNFLK